MVNQYRQADRVKRARVLLALTGLVALLGLVVFVASRGDGKRKQVSASSEEPPTTSTSTTTASTTTTTSEEPSSTTASTVATAAQPEQSTTTTTEPEPSPVTIEIELDPDRAEAGYSTLVRVTVTDTEGRAWCTLATSINGSSNGSTHNLCADYCQFHSSGGGQSGFKVDELGPATFTVTVGMVDDGCARTQVDSYSQDFTIDVVPPGGDPPTPGPEVTGGEGDWESLQTALDDARARWSASGPAGGYELRYSRTCAFCGWEQIVAVDADGNIVSNGWYQQSVEAMFDDLQQLIDDDADSVRVSFDAVYGLPATYSVDIWENAIDDEYTASVRWFGPH